MSTFSGPVTAAQAPEVAAYWAERRRYLERIRKSPEVRQRFWREVIIYLARRLLWSFGFFPIFMAFWVPFVLASFNPVVMASDLIPLLQDFVGANPEVQATTLSTLAIAWASVGFSSSFLTLFSHRSNRLTNTRQTCTCEHGNNLTMTNFRPKCDLTSILAKFRHFLLHISVLTG